MEEFGGQERRKHGGEGVAPYHRTLLSAARLPPETARTAGNEMPVKKKRKTGFIEAEMSSEERLLSSHTKG